MKKDSTLPEGNICETMFILFQLVITFMIIIFVRLFYTSVFYFPTKKLAEQYESLSEVIVSFTQMSCYNVYVTLLSKKILDSQYMMLLTQVKQYMPTLAKAI